MRFGGLQILESRTEAIQGMALQDCTGVRPSKKSPSELSVREGSFTMKVEGPVSRRKLFNDVRWQLVSTKVI